MRYSALTIAMAFGAAACSSKKEEPVQVAAAAPVEVAPATVAALPAAEAIPIKVYKTPTCGCCKAWVDHLEQNGFTVETMDMPDLSSVKTKYGVKSELQSCHTAVVGDYVVEGHVPADLIIKMMKEKPAIAGLAVPGMPSGSPGMEGGTKEAYDVLTFDKAGSTTVYARR